MTIRLSVTYAATDGSMPESVEVEWTDTGSSVGLTDGLLAVLDRLLTTPQQRYVVSMKPSDAMERGRAEAITRAAHPGPTPS